MSGTCAEHQRSHRMIADRKREPLTSASCRIRARPQRSAPRAPPTDTACSLISASSFVAHCAAYPKKSLLQTLGICTPPLAGPRCVAVSQSKVQIDDWLRAPSRRPSSRCSVEPVTVSWRGSSDNAGLCSRAVRNPRGSRVRRRGTGPRGAGHAGGGDLSRRARAALDDDAANACVHPRLTFRRSCSACEERAPPGTKTRAQLRRLLPLSAVVISYAS